MKQKSLEKDLFVADIAFEAEEEDLLKLFAVCGTVRAIHMMTDQRTGKFKGCAFIKMSTAAEAKDALHMLDGTRLINRCISVSAAQPKKVAEPAPETTAKAPRARRPRGQGLKRQR
ncbi:MAG TPA: RNA-binding protein [Malonomonas sp.]